MMSIPRDLLPIPGVGVGVKINAAYENGGERGYGARRSRAALGRRQNSRSTTSSTSTSAASGARSTTSAASTPTSTALLQRHRRPERLRRDRHRPRLPEAVRHGTRSTTSATATATTTSCAPPASRTSCARCARRRAPKLLAAALGNLKKLAQVFGALLRPRQEPRLHEGDLQVRQDRAVHRAATPVREVRFRVPTRRTTSNLVASRGAARRRSSRVPRRRKGSATPRQSRADRGRERRRPSAKRKREQAVGDPGPRGRARGGREPGDRRGAQDRLPSTSRRCAQRRRLRGPGAAHVHDQGRARQAPRRLPARGRQGIVGEYYGVQGTTWRAPPILDDPHDTIVRNGRKLMVYRDGKRVRLVAWRTRKAVYWVANTLTQSLSDAADDRRSPLR